MSTSNEPPVKVQVLYLVRRKKWETKDVSVSGFDGKCQIKVESTAWKILRQKTMEIEVSGNNFCVVEMGTAGCHSNVIGLLCMKRDSKIQGHFFKSQHKEILNNLMTILRECCRVDSFDVNLDEDLNCFPSQSTKAQLHVFHDKICLSSNSGYDFKILCEYPLNSLSNWQQDRTNVILTIVHKGKEEKLLLKTDKGRGICAKLSSSVQEGYQGVQQCDGNSNIITIPSRISKSCEILDHLHRRTRPKANSMLSSKKKPKPKSQLTPELSMDTKDFKQNYPDPCFAGPGHFESNVTVESKVKLTALEICDETNGQNSCSSPSDIHDSVTLQPSPPPIPQRQAKKNSAKGGESLPRAYTLPPSFRIVSQLDVGERQHLKSEISSKGIKTVEIKELVQPIRVDPLYRNFGNHCDSYTGLKINVETNKTSESCGVCSPEGEEQDIFSMAGSEGGSEPCVEEPTVMQNRASPQPFMMSDSVPNSHADRKIQDEDKEQSSDSTCHYVNLPEGSRPSCYLYMNLPNLKTAPKEAAVYVNHVFMSHSMQGIYENVQQFYNEKLEECGAPPVPPPVLKPRQPPPRLPKRACGGGQRVQPTPPRSPPHMGAPHSPPPPRPPKKHGGVSKMLERGIQRQQDIQVTIAVFASKAVAGREWFLRIVVMQHDPDDSTFKMVMDRELASNYRLMQTHPFSISSDIVISLKHQCKQFKLTSENAQEVGYNIIKDLLHGFWFVIEFHLEHLSSDGEHFVGNVCVEPKDLLPGEKCPVNKRVNLGINEDFELKVHLQRVNCKQHGILRGQENQTSKHVISDYAKRKKMCGLLDISSYKQNWRDVAGKLRFSWEEIKGIEDKAHRCPTFSPMEDVLTTWEQRDPESSLERLIRVLRDIERFDVISDLGFPVGSEIL